MSDFTSKFIAVLMIAVITAINIWGTRKSSDLQNWSSILKIGLIIGLSAILLFLGRHTSEIRPALGTTLRGANLVSNFGLAMIAALWTYEGWQFGTYSAGEVIEPQKTFPRAFLLGSLSLMSIYLVAVVAYLVALGPATATTSDAIAATAMTAVLGPWAGKIVAVTILISTFGATNSVILTAPRVFYAMASDNLFFKKLAEVHPRFKTPAAAILALGLWSAILACAGKFSELAGGAIFIGWIFYGLGAAAIFPIRRAAARVSGLKQAVTYRVPGYPWTPLLFVLAAAAIVFNPIYLAFHDPRQFVYIAVAMVLLLLGLPAFFFWRKRPLA
jgi:APA family basic amino acid/polyamine antiporter